MSDVVKCHICKKRKIIYEMELLGVDGDFICKDGNCKEKYERLINRINNMSDKEFKIWMMN